MLNRRQRGLHSMNRDGHKRDHKKHEILHYDVLSPAVEMTAGLKMEFNGIQNSPKYDQPA